jgi:hypothetical protein
VRNRARRFKDTHGYLFAVDAVLDAANSAAEFAGILRKRDPSPRSFEALKLEGGVVGIGPGLELRREAID